MKRVFQLHFAIAIALFALVPVSAQEQTKPAGPPLHDDVQDFVFLAEARPVLVRLHVRMDGKPIETAWHDLMKYLFDYVDVNKDGVLSKDEVDRAPTVNQVTGGILGRGFGGGGRGPRGAAPEGLSLADFDSDGDGKVTVAEFAA